MLEFTKPGILCSPTNLAQDHFQPIHVIFPSQLERGGTCTGVHLFPTVVNCFQRSSDCGVIRRIFEGESRAASNKRVRGPIQERRDGGGSAGEGLEDTQGARIVKGRKEKRVGAGVKRSDIFHDTGKMRPTLHSQATGKTLKGTDLITPQDDKIPASGLPQGPDCKLEALGTKVVGREEGDSLVRRYLKSRKEASPAFGTVSVMKGLAVYRVMESLEAKVASRIDSPVVLFHLGRDAQGGHMG